MSNNIVSSIIEDRESNIWIGVWGSGVCQYLGDNFEIFNKETGLPDNIVHAVLIDKDYSLWVGTEKGITRYIFSDTLMNSIASVDHFTVDDGLSDNDIKCMYQDTRDFIWIGTKTSVSRYDPVKRTFKNFAEIKGLEKKRVITINEDKNGNIWLCDLGTGCVKFSIDQNKIISSEQFNKENGFFSNSIWTVYKDRKGSLWFGSNDAGLAVYDGENFKIINEQQGLTHKRPGSITEDKYGNLWIGSIGGGVYKFDGNEFTNYTTKDGISSDNPYLIIGDDIGNVWIGTNTGVDQLNVSTGKIRHYGKSEGFLGIETNQNAVFKDPLGNIWFGTIKGLVKCNPSSFKENLVEPVTAIKNVRLFLKDEGIPEKNIFPYNKNHLTFDFTGISYSNPDGVKFQYMLEGFDKEWSPPTREHLATYSNIPPGKYRFLLVASNSDGLRNKEPAIFEFEITPPFWGTWWFYSLCAIMALLSVYVFIKRRERMLKLSKITLEKTVMQRTMELKMQNTKLKEANHEIKIKNKLIIDSILYAKRIQEAILPSLEQIEKNFSDLFIFYQPKDIVSGDFYWFAKIDDVSVIVTADCTGHGVPAALMSMIGNDILNQIVADKNIISPSQALTEFDIRIKEVLKQKGEREEAFDGMDIAMCAIHMDKNMLQFSGAYRPLYLIRNGELLEYKASKFSIGGYSKEEKIFNTYDINFYPGDTIYTFTDGFVDQFGGPRGKKFMKKRFKNIIIDMQRLNMEEQSKYLVKTLNNWKGDLEQVDDILVFGIRF